MFLTTFRQFYKNRSQFLGIFNSQTRWKSKHQSKTKARGKKYDSVYFDVPAQELAMKLLGQSVVRKIEGRHLKGIIVETEAYLGPEDLASHSAQHENGIKTSLTSNDPGCCVFTSVYGSHIVFSISSKGKGACVLLRALEPVTGLDIMLNNRKAKPKKEYKAYRLCSGPAKLCTAFGLTPDLNGLDLSDPKNDTLFLTKSIYEIMPKDIVKCPRIGLSSNTGEWEQAPLRYYIIGHTSVSKRNKEYENKLKTNKNSQK